jgi:hypothetical protein
MRQSRSVYIGRKQMQAGSNFTECVIELKGRGYVYNG